MAYVTVVPAYGRDYKSQAAVKADWNADKDFEAASMGPDMGRKVNKSDVAGTGMRVMVRYARMTKVVQVQ